MRPAIAVSSGPRATVAEDDAVAGDDAASAGRASRAAATSWSRSIAAAAAIGYSLSSRSALYAASPRPAWHRDAEDNAAAVSNRARDSWWTPHSDCNIRPRPATPPASVLQANSASVSAAAVAVDPRSMMRAS